MKGYALRSVDDETITEMEFPEEELTGDQVRVRITHSGVCHSDVHIREGGFELGDGEFYSNEAGGAEYPSSWATRSSAWSNPPAPTRQSRRASRSSSTRGSAAASAPRVRPARRTVAPT